MHHGGFVPGVLGCESQWASGSTDAALDGSYGSRTCGDGELAVLEQHHWRALQFVSERRQLGIRLHKWDSRLLLFSEQCRYLLVSTERQWDVPHYVQLELGCTGLSKSQHVQRSIQCTSAPFTTDLLQQRQHSDLSLHLMHE